MAAPVLIAAAAVGTALQVYGTFTAARSRAAAMRRQAVLNKLRADEVLQRTFMNNSLLMERSFRTVGEQQSQFAGSGRAQSATTLAMLSETLDLAFAQATRNTRAAQWQATMINMGADSDLVTAGAVEKGGAISALGQGFSGAAEIADSSPGLGGSESTATSSRSNTATYPSALSSGV